MTRVSEGRIRINLLVTPYVRAKLNELTERVRQKLNYYAIYPTHILEALIRHVLKLYNNDVDRVAEVLAEEFVPMVQERRKRRVSPKYIRVE